MRLGLGSCNSKSWKHAWCRRHNVSDIRFFLNHRPTPFFFCLGLRGKESFGDGCAVNSGPYGPSAQAAHPIIHSTQQNWETSGPHSSNPLSTSASLFFSGTDRLLHPPWLLRRGETRSKTPPGGRYAYAHAPPNGAPVLAINSGNTLTLSSTPCCRRARNHGSPRACARRTSSRASPSGSSLASSSTFPRRGDPSPAPRRLRPPHPREAPAPSGRRGARLPQAARSLRW